MSNFIGRMESELTSLRERLLLLDNFFDEGRHKELSKEELKMLKKQEKHMEKYHDALVKRLNYYSKKEKKSHSEVRVVNVGSIEDLLKYILAGDKPDGKK